MVAGHIKKKKKYHKVYQLNFIIAQSIGEENGRVIVMQPIKIGDFRPTIENALFS